MELLAEPNRKVFLDLWSNFKTLTTFSILSVKIPISAGIESISAWSGKSLRMKIVGSRWLVLKWHSQVQLFTTLAVLKEHRQKKNPMIYHAAMGKDLIIESHLV